MLCSFLFIYLFIYFEKLFVWLSWVLVVGAGSLVVEWEFFKCGMWDPFPRPGVELRPPALGAWRLSHWTTREVPIMLCLLETFIPSAL